MLEGGGGGATGLLNKGGGEQQASWFSKQQAVEFPQVLTSYYKYLLISKNYVLYNYVAKFIVDLILGELQTRYSRGSYIWG